MLALIRPERPHDRDAIRAVNTAAFGQPDEADLVERLRAEGYAVVSLVAAVADAIVGHILFSRLPIETPSGIVNGVALAPMAVLPAFQRNGIGSSLVRRGLDECRQAGERIVVVLGHPAFYPRFGFSSRLAQQLTGPFSGDAFMAYELVPGAMEEVQGEARYPSPFGVR